MGRGGDGGQGNWACPTCLRVKTEPLLPGLSEVPRAPVHGTVRAGGGGRGLASAEQGMRPQAASPTGEAGLERAALGWDSLLHL